MNVLHLIAPVAFGGGEALLVNLLRERRAGLDEQVASIYTSPRFNEWLDRIGVRHWELRTRDIGHGVSRRNIGFDMLATLARLPAFARITGREKIDLVHAHGFPAAVLFPLVRALRRMAGVYTHHFIRRLPAEPERWLLSRAYNRFSICTGVSETVSQSMAAAFPGVRMGFRTIHNCVGNAFYDAKPDPEFAARWPKGRAVFVHAARFSYFKNHRLVVEALGRLSPTERARLYVVFAGEGEEKPAIERSVRAAGLDNDVLFLGTVPYARVPGLLAAADYALLPSEVGSEGMSVSSVECLAAGRPLLSLDSPLMREVVGPGGIQVPPERLHEGFLRMLAEGPQLREAARKQAEMFRPGRIKDAYVACYREALAR